MSLFSPEDEIRRRIAGRGRITFAEFMEVALYWPQGGYYRGAGPVGPTGDYYTSPLAHPAFGALLAVQLFQMWELLGRPSPFDVVELGAGDGLLCRDVLACARCLPPQFRRSLRYLCLDFRTVAGLEREPAEEDESINVFRIAAASPYRAGASDKEESLPLKGIKGCFVSNELLDAFPVHQVTVREGQLREVYISLEQGDLIETLGEPSTPALARRLDDLGVGLTEGQVAEINLGLEEWARQVAAALDKGFVLTIDYGHPAPELYDARKRPRGTLTTYYRHLQTDAPLRRIGQQDMTTQVDFTAAIRTGQQAGLEPLGLTLQRQFLNNLGLAGFRQRLAQIRLPPRQAQSNLAGMVDLARPGGLGDFKVLAQGKSVGDVELWGFSPSPEAQELSQRMPLPLLTSHHLDLIRGRYPQPEQEFELEQLWPTEGG